MQMSHKDHGKRWRAVVLAQSVLRLPNNTLDCWYETCIVTLKRAAGRPPPLRASGTPIPLMQSRAQILATRWRTTSALFPAVIALPMDVYLTSLAIGGIGLVAMALGGTVRHGQHHSGSSGHAGHNGHAGGSHGGHAHGGHAHGGHAHSSHGAHATHSHALDSLGAHGHSHSSDSHAGDGHSGATQMLLALMSPRVLFSVCLGLGTTGLLLRNALQGPALFAVAVAGGWAFERFIVRPIWNFTFRFASAPALTLESALMSEATAVTRFDANGQGLIAIEVDGHVVQLLGTLDSTNRAMRAQVLAGARLRIEDVDAPRNRCTVSPL
jgi:hypothetical protein